MARKKGKEVDTRAALVDAALSLILHRGGDAVSVDAIAAHASLSKGTFFHFFPTKFDLLEAACDRVASEVCQELEPLFASHAGDPLSRLEMLLDVTRWCQSDPRHAAGGLWRTLARSRASVMLAMVRARIVELLCPAGVRLVTEGNALRQFRVADVESTARLLLEWVVVSIEGCARALLSHDGESPEALLGRVNATLTAIERTLGAGEGVLHRADAETLARCMVRG
ncbi:MAG: TetR/AcrR family transcriptional regulator [Polyangiaceae bacterium]|nr:TetR/AcrR family transcriptional regulator [Polyangiaceae bacterium]